MEDIVDLIATDSSASDISDKIKEILFTKATDRIDSFKPEVAELYFWQMKLQFPEIQVLQPVFQVPLLFVL